MQLRKRTKKWVDLMDTILTLTTVCLINLRYVGVLMGWTGCSLMDNEPVIKGHERIKLGVE